jgi:predicted transcriptional regulator
MSKGINMEAKDIVIRLKQLGMTQIEIADETGIPQPSISKIESGKVGDVLSKGYRALEALLKKRERTAARRTKPTPTQPA